MIERSTSRFPGIIFFVLYLVFLTSLVFSFRACCSIAIGLILVAGIVKNKMDTNRFFSSRLKNPVVIACVLYFLFQLISVIYSSNSHEAWKQIRLKSAMVVIPIALFSGSYLNESTRARILKWYCCVLVVGCMIALGWACENYLRLHKPTVFLYHALVGIYSGHAIQFSILVFIGLVHLFEMLIRKTAIVNRTFHLSMIFFLLVFLFLLSSKLVIAFFLLYFIYSVIRLLHHNTINKTVLTISFVSIIALFAIVFLTVNPISNRFKDILQTDFHFMDRRQFTPGEYFNGLQFRLLQWRFVPEILNEQGAWFTGVGVGDAQELLNQKYIAGHMYTGTVERGDKGFIGYNTHNQFLEALLQTGVPGAFLFLLIIWSLVHLARLARNAELSITIILLLTYSFNESVFESQYSLFIFLFFPLFFYVSKRNSAT